VKLGLLNLRGSDIPFNPVFFSWVVVKSSGDIHLFVDQNKVTRAVRQHLNLDADVEMKETGIVGNNNVIAVLHSYEEIDSFLKTEVKSWTFYLKRSYNFIFDLLDPVTRKENMDQR
jgi:Creatinase/Prolidase N-terminal domain